MPQQINSVASSLRIRHGLLIQLNVGGTNYYFANTYNPVTYQGAIYSNLGAFLNVSEIQDDLRATNASIQVSLSGVPSYILGEPNLVSLVLTQPIKGSRIFINRAFFDPDTANVQEVVRRYSGYVSNYTLSESIDQESNEMTNSITLQCSSIHGIIERQISGRRTNPKDFGTDSSMYRVPLIAVLELDHILFRFEFVFML
jgi:hypothetical protein